MGQKRLLSRSAFLQQHSQVRLWPSELVTIDLLFALKGGYSRAFYRWRKVNAPHLVALVQAGVGFKDGNRIFPHIDEEVELLVEDTTIRIAA